MEDTVIINLYFTDQKKPYRRPKKNIAGTVLVLLGMFCMIKKTPMNVSMIHG